MSAEKKKPSVGETTPRSSISKSIKKSSKSRVKTPKPDSSSKSSTNGQTPTSSSSSPSVSVTAEMPTTPTSSMDVSRERSHHRGYAAFSPRTIKIVWEQHDTSDTDLSPDVLPTMAEDVSYKVWELAKNIKTYAMHSGGFVTSDLVNEVIKDSDCPPVLGAMDTEWDRIDYDGSYYFNSDKIIELRSEYQRDVQITMPMEASFRCTWPIQGGHRVLMQSFMQSVFLITLGGTEQDFDCVRQYMYSAPFVGSCYKVLLQKIIQTLAFKQTNHVKIRCWLLMQTLAQHPSCRDVYIREEYFHLAEIFITQLMDTFEAIPLAVKSDILEEDVIMSNAPMDVDETALKAEPNAEIKIENVKQEIEEKPIILEQEEHKLTDVKQEFVPTEDDLSQPEHTYRLERDDDQENIADQMEGIEFSPYTADKVDSKLVNYLCETIGFIGAINEYFNTECMHLILRRLEKFFDKRQMYTASDYEVISRAIRGLFALGEYAFREFIPYMEKMRILDMEDIPESLCVEFARCAIFLRGHDDIFLYEWLNELCSCKLLPFMTHYAHYHQKLIKHRHVKRRVATFKIIPKVVAKRITLPPVNVSKKEPTPLEDIFPDQKILAKPPSAIRFKFPGCRQIPVKAKSNRTTPPVIDSNATKASDLARSIIIARRKLFKPLSDEQKCVQLSNFHLLRI